MFSKSSCVTLRPLTTLVALGHCGKETADQTGHGGFLLVVFIIVVVIGE